MTATEALRRVHEALEEDTADPLRYPSLTVLEYLNQGAQLYLVRAESAHASTTITQTAGRLEYTLPADCLRVSRVSWVSGGQNYPVIPTTMLELDTFFAYKNGWADDTGTRATHYYIFGLDAIGLYPILTSGTQTYTVHYIKAPSVGLPGITFDQVPEEDHEALVCYALARCLAADRKPAEAAQEYARFADAVKKARRRRSSPDRRWSMSYGNKVVA